VLKEIGRVAIWNREKIVSVIAMGMWATEIALFINSKYLLQITRECFINLVISQVSYG
jgi:hypothetical protein